MTAFEFEEFPKIPRLKREVVITEKIDGTNAQIAWFELNSPELLDQAQNDPFNLAIFPGKNDGDSPLALYTGSRNRWIKPGNDNFGFAAWVYEHAEELLSLGVGRHYGEWYGKGIQRDYGLWEKHFALFNTARWNPENPNKPVICQVVPVLARGDSVNDDEVMEKLFNSGSVLVPGYGRPEGIVVWHSASRQLYKRTFEQDGGKWVGAAPEFAVPV
jgi:RNA ligase